MAAAITSGVSNTHTSPPLLSAAYFAIAAHVWVPSMPHVSIVTPFDVYPTPVKQWPFIGFGSPAASQVKPSFCGIGFSQALGIASPK